MRLAALLLVAACSSSAKQAPEPAGSAGSAMPPAGAPASGGSAADPWAGKPGDPAAERAELRADIDIMCGAAKVTGGKTFNEVGPYIAEHMTGSFKLELFADFRNATLDEIIERMRKGMAKANVQKCDTVDVLLANDPRKQH